jgi:hypothetical protein
MTGWTTSSGSGYTLYSVQGPGTSTDITLNLTPYMHDGATLATVTIWLIVADAHAGGVPGTLPNFAVYRDNLTSSALQSLLSTTTVVFSPTPGTGAAWYAAGARQSFTMTCDQNNVIDKSTYIYYLNLQDENGANAVAGNYYLGLVLGFTTITDLRAP